MKRLVLSALAALLCITAAGAQTVPKTTVVQIHVQNRSNTCAWVTIYWGRVYTPWTIENAPEGRPRFVGHNASQSFFVRFTNPTSIPLPAEIKVRAEYTRHANCSGGTLADHDNYNKGINADRKILEHIDVTSVLSGPPYSVSRPQ